MIQSFKRGKKRDTGRFPMRGLSWAKNRVVEGHIQGPYSGQAEGQLEGHTDEEGKIRGLKACRGPE